MNRKIFVSLILFWVSYSQAQELKIKSQVELLPISISSYMINAVNPGFKLGVDYPMAEIEKVKTKKR